MTACRLFFAAPTRAGFAAATGLLLSLLPPTPGQSAEEPRVFRDLPESIAFAKEGNRLILFLLVPNFGRESESILEAVHAELAGRGHEFAIVRCRNESADHRRLFAERFKQDPEKMPLGVIATAAGGVVVGTNGKAPEAYRLMIRAARVQSGLEKDAEKIAAIEAEIEGGDEAITDSIFGLKRRDVAGRMLLLSAYRDWTLDDGATVLTAALLEAKGDTGVFVKRGGERVEVAFDRLSAGDTAFLTNLLKKEE